MINSEFKWGVHTGPLQLCGIVNNLSNHTFYANRRNKNSRGAKNGNDCSSRISATLINEGLPEESVLESMSLPKDGPLVPTSMVQEITHSVSQKGSALESLASTLSIASKYSRKEVGDIGGEHLVKLALSYRYNQFVVTARGMIKTWSESNIPRFIMPSVNGVNPEVIMLIIGCYFSFFSAYHLTSYVVENKITTLLERIGMEDVCFLPIHADYLTVALLGEVKSDVHQPDTKKDHISTIWYKLQYTTVANEYLNLLDESCTTNDAVLKLAKLVVDVTTYDLSKDLNDVINNLVKVIRYMLVPATQITDQDIIGFGINQSRVEPFRNKISKWKSSYCNSNVLQLLLDATLPSELCSLGRIRAFRECFSLARFSMRACGIPMVTLEYISNYTITASDFNRLFPVFGNSDLSTNQPTPVYSSLSYGDGTTFVGVPYSDFIGTVIKLPSKFFKFGKLNGILMANSYSHYDIPATVYDTAHMDAYKLITRLEISFQWPEEVLEGEQVTLSRYSSALTQESGSLIRIQMEAGSLPNGSASSSRQEKSRSEQLAEIKKLDREGGSPTTQVRTEKYIAPKASSISPTDKNGGPDGGSLPNDGPPAGSGNDGNDPSGPGSKDSPPSEGSGKGLKDNSPNNAIGWRPVNSKNNKAFAGSTLPAGILRSVGRNDYTKSLIARGGSPEKKDVGDAYEYYLRNKLTQGTHKLATNKQFPYKGLYSRLVEDSLQCLTTVPLTSDVHTITKNDRRLFKLVIKPFNYNMGTESRVERLWPSSGYQFQCTSDEYLSANDDYSKQIDKRRRELTNKNPEHKPDFKIEPYRKYGMVTIINGTQYTLTENFNTEGNLLWKLKKVKIKFKDLNLIKIPIKLEQLPVAAHLSDIQINNMMREHQLANRDEKKGAIRIHFELGRGNHMSYFIEYEDDMFAALVTEKGYEIGAYRYDIRSILVSRN